MSVALSRQYLHRFGAPLISRVDPRIFSLSHHSQCMDCTYCHDSCCQFGADIELPRVAAMEKYQAELEAYLGVPRSEWFWEHEDDFGIHSEPEYPGGQYTRTAVVPLPAGRSAHNGEACIFLDPVNRGCRIHRFALERGIDVHEIKPMICLMFPVLFEHGELRPAIEFDDQDLVCEGPGESLYRSARQELLYYFGDDFIAEMDQLETLHSHGPKSVPHPARTPLTMAA
jgi:Fe-S-cluster containining protein